MNTYFIEIAKNPDTSFCDLKKIFNKLLIEFASNINQLPQNYLEILDAIANNQNMSVDFLRRLAASKAKDIRYILANGSCTPFDILEELSEDEDEDIRRAVERNPNYTK